MNTVHSFKQFAMSNFIQKTFSGLFFYLVNEHCSLVKISLLCFVFMHNNLNAQGNLQDYLDLGLETNLVLQKRNISVKTAAAALAEAETLKSIKVDFMPTYTAAAGGRSIDIPVGDLLNPVYGTLNQLTASQDFPQIENVSELLNPNNFYDLKIRATYPLFNKDIGLNEDIKFLQLNIAEQNIAVYQRELKQQISTAYLDFQKALRAVLIYEEAQILIKENIRVNEGLFRNGKVNRTVVLQSKNDSINNTAQIKNARLTAKKAAAYLNFLTNTEFDKSIEKDIAFNTLPPPEVGDFSVENREELRQLQSVETIQKISLQLAENGKKPQINVFVDAGLQDSNFQVNENSFYVLGGVSMNLNLYDGGKTKAKIRQSAAAAEQAENERKYLLQQLKLSAFDAQQQLMISENKYNAAAAQISLSQRIYDENIKLYQAGKINYITLADTRNKLISNNLQKTIALFDVWKDYFSLRSIFAN